MLKRFTKLKWAGLIVTITLVAVLSVFPTGTESAADQGQIFDDVLLMDKSVDCGNESLSGADIRNVEVIGHCTIGIGISGNVKVLDLGGCECTSLTIVGGADIGRNVRTEEGVSYDILILGGDIHGNVDHRGPTAKVEMEGGHIFGNLNCNGGSIIGGTVDGKVTDCGP